MNNVIKKKTNRTIHFSPSDSENKQFFRQIVETKKGLVNKIAKYLISKMPSSIYLEDLIQSGVIGLLESAIKYDQKKGASFDTFAGIRIHGAMIDEIRKGDWGPRSVYRKSRKAAKIKQQLEKSLSRPPSNKEISYELGVGISDLNKIFLEHNSCMLYSYDDIFCGEKSTKQAVSMMSDPFENIAKKKFQLSFEAAIKTLSNNERSVIELYYDKKMSLKQISRILNVSESRVSQIHTHATKMLSDRLSEWR